MPKLHVLLKKEELEETKLQDGKIAVVFDVLLATSTIVSCLHYGAKEVIPVMDGDEARKAAERLKADSFCLTGEFNGATIEGFLDPNPLQLQKTVGGKTVVLSTTNGTVAIRNSATAARTYIASLLNGQAAAELIAKRHKNETVIAVCSGSGGEFCLEDFYGAGYFIDCLLEESDTWELTDAAQAALLFYQSRKQEAAEILKASRVGKMLLRNEWEEEIEFAANRGIIPTVPEFKGNTIASEGDERYED
ncbi:2-phosphosulfolactate phosphatase [Planococcus lenghuensis]|uniref:Probable 2-phosphosulfolactate phosphatase n=1 Tax=Planococcus lenghuensis TaxID=2213202 RepID=A0A1Q2KV05_9BACL|nr:2-phosphosulfolactate phosphatase [Planococcus lenghuensis]AQQ51973.1 2-phosphosulfolactate phosphatase [Planococcus lenghuensis]